MQTVDSFDVVVHDGSFGFTLNGERFIRLASVAKLKNVVDDDIAALLPDQ